MDIFTKQKRSEIMSSIRGKWTKPERMAHNILKGNKIKHKMHPKIIGNPDILICDSNTVIFIDGCFWHGCPRHFKMPKTNKRFWREKIARNRERDKRVIKEICRTKKYKCKRIWECQLSSASLLAAAEAH